MNLFGKSLIKPYYSLILEDLSSNHTSMDFTLNKPKVLFLFASILINYRWKLLKAKPQVQLVAN